MRLEVRGTTLRERRGPTTAACLGAPTPVPVMAGRAWPPAIARGTEVGDAFLTATRARNSVRVREARGVASDVACGARDVIEWLTSIPT